MNRNYFRKGQFITISNSKASRPVISVSKKISTKAVVRNRLRRQIRELLRQYGIESVIVRVTKLPPAKESFDLFNQDIEQCFATWQ